MNKVTDVWLFVEQRNGTLMNISLELLGKGLDIAKNLKSGLAAVLIGKDVEKLAEEILAYGADKVYLVEDPRLEIYQSSAYASVITGLIQQHNPEIFLLGATAVGLDLAPRVAAKVQTGLTAHCVDLQLEEVAGKNSLVALIPGWGDNFFVKIVCPDKRPQMVTVKPGVFEKPAQRVSSKGQIIKVKADIREEDFKAKVTKMVESKPAGIPLEEAKVVVASGWGVGSAEKFKLVEELAATLNGVTAGTRPVADAKWIPEEKMIGSSGKTVTPDLFISVGASGAIHFTTGFIKSKVIVAVDQNPKAPIFDIADIGIVGDAAQVMTCLVNELKAAAQAST
ncbi:electron transfer flavoprotein subunit alpha/FixB family protein [Chloroflexota bacterium]